MEIQANHRGHCCDEISAGRKKHIKLSMGPLKKQAVIGTWILDRELGGGGQGKVWKVRYARDKHSPPAALKICSDDSAKARARFEREIALLRDQNDPGIVRIRDAGSHDGAPYYVMELAATSLQQVVVADTAGTRMVRDSGMLLLTFLRQAGLALANLHSRGVLHRDVKPSNILLMLDPPEPMKAVLADLGVAAHEQEQGRLTVTHEVVGTPIFRAPEAWLGTHTSASDVYAFGKTLEFVFAGGLPSGVGPGRCSRSPMLTPELWDCLDALLQKACAYKPEDRFEGGRELFEAMPETVVARIGLSGVFARTAPPVPSPAETTLSSAEIAALAGVIARCPAESDWVAIGWLKKETDLTAYQFSLALRRLAELDFVSSTQRMDQDGDAYTVFQPTAAGVRWAHSHPAEVDAAVNPPSPPAEPAASEDDIPF